MSIGIKRNLLLLFITFVVFELLYCVRGIDEQLYYKDVMQILDNYDGMTPDLLRAEELIKEMFKSNKKSAPAYVAMGRLAYKSGYINGKTYEEGSLENAIKYFEKAIKIQPDFFDAFYFGTYPYIYLKNVENACKFADKAKEIDHSSLKVSLLYAEIAKIRKDVVAVEAFSRKVLDGSDDKKLLSDAMSLLIWVYKSQKRYDLAEEYYKKTIELEQNAWSMINYSSFLNSRERYDESILYGEKALRLMNFSMGHHILSKAFYGKSADLCWKRKQYFTAAEFFDSSVQHDSLNENAWYGLGLCYYHMGYDNKNVIQLKKAKEALKTSISLNPNFKQASSTMENLQKLLDFLGQ
jgi:tetratricopeptide (TPR) repeat protein